MTPADLEDHTRPLTEGEQVAVLDRTRELQPGQRVGAFRLIRALGQGGMGQVWLAEQQEPLVRQVALKLQKQRLSGGIAEAYFQVERQALAQLVHPYIGQIYDAGTLPDGALYFAMEYVDGLTLDRFVQGRKLDVDATVALMVRICQGAHYAHQRGLIHRDLKPGNILVIEVGGQAIPKIIDFGVAIGIDPRSGLAQTQRRAGTRAYMAPEQSQPTADGIDVRADVFALGTLLSECLCQSLGITLDLLGSERMRSLLQGASASELETEVSSNRPPGIRAAKRIPAELRAIALKAMAVERNQRYESAAAMADDLERWRQARPVRAMGSGRWYAVRCFMRRYRVATAAGVLIVLALVGGLITAWYGLQEATSARQLAEQRREKAERLIGYMLGDFAEKLRQLGKLELLDDVSSEAMKYLGEQQPATATFFRAQAMRTLGEVPAGRGQYAEARKIFADAEIVLSQSPPNDSALPDLLMEQGTLAYWRGHVEYKTRNLEAAEKHWLNYAKFAAQLEPLTAESGLGLLETSYAHDNLGTLFFEKADNARAAQMFAESISEKTRYLEARPIDAAALDALSNTYSWLGRVYESSSSLQESLDSYRRQLEIIQRVRKSTPNSSQAKFREALAHFWIASSAMNLGESNEAIIRYQSAVALLTELQSFDSTQVGWGDALSSASLELLWAQHLTAPTLQSHVSAGMLLDRIRARVLAEPGSKRMFRQLCRAELRMLLLEPTGGDTPSRLRGVRRNADKLLALDGESEDRRLGLLMRLELLLLESSTGTRAVGNSLDLPKLDGNTGFQDLELLARAAKLRNDEQMFSQLQERLEGIGYRHPDYERFLAAIEGER